LQGNSFDKSSEVRKKGKKKKSRPPSKQQTEKERIEGNLRGLSITDLSMDPGESNAQVSRSRSRNEECNPQFNNLNTFGNTSLNEEQMASAQKNMTPKNFKVRPDSKSTNYSGSHKRENTS